MILAGLGRLAYFDGYNFLGAISPSGLGDLPDIGTYADIKSLGDLIARAQGNKNPVGLPIGPATKDTWNKILTDKGAGVSAWAGCSFQDLYQQAAAVGTMLDGIRSEPEGTQLAGTFDNAAANLDNACKDAVANFEWDVIFVVPVDRSHARSAALRDAYQRMCTNVTLLAGLAGAVSNAVRAVAARKAATSAAQTNTATAIANEAGAVGAQAGEARLFGIPVTWLAGAGAAVVLIMFLTRKKA